MILSLLRKNILASYIWLLSWLCRDNFVYFAIYSRDTKDYQILVDYFSFRGIIKTWYYKFFPRTKPIIYNQKSMGISIYTQPDALKYILASYCIIHSHKKVVYAVLNEEIDLTKEINQYGFEGVFVDNLVNLLLKYKNIKSYDLTDYKLRVLYESNILQEVTLQEGDLF